MTTSTKELSHMLDEIARSARSLDTGSISRIKTSAMRLRELDKPDCVYTLCADDSATPQTLESACGGAMWYLGDDGKGAYPKFCHHCQGAVKSGGTHD